MRSLWVCSPFSFHGIFLLPTISEDEGALPRPQGFWGNVPVNIVHNGQKRIQLATQGSWDLGILLYIKIHQAVIRSIVFVHWKILTTARYHSEISKPIRLESTPNTTKRSKKIYNTHSDSLPKIFTKQPKSKQKPRNQA